MKYIKQSLFKNLILCSLVVVWLPASGQILNEVELSNGTIKIKLDLNSGGAISYLSEAKNNYNVINIHDKGRYVQQSYYNGQHIDRTLEGQNPNWSPWNWNPIQAGDSFRNGSRIITYSKTATQLYVKNHPKLWDMNNEDCQCYFETWITLEGTAAKVRNKLTLFRTDNRWIDRLYHQELPAVYTRGDLHNLYTYAGASPWTTGNLSKIVNVSPPWAYWTAKESWAALVNNNNWGVGVYNPISTFFIGGYRGPIGGGPTDSSTGYFSPLISKKLGKTGTFEYTYYLILGNLNDIRRFAYHKRGISLEGDAPNNSLSWEFNNSGNLENWRKSGGTGSISVSGGELNVVSSAIDPQIIRNVSFDPGLYDFLKIGMSNYTNNNDMDIFWSNALGGFSAAKRVRVLVTGNQKKEYTFDLRNISSWKNGGQINAIRIDPPGNGSPAGEHVKIDYIRFTKN